MRIELSELRRAVDTVLDHVESVAGQSVELSNDYFWSVPLPDIYEVPDKPELTIGQLSDSWNNVRHERVGNRDDTISFAAVWLGDVLKSIGHELIA